MSRVSNARGGHFAPKVEPKGRKRSFALLVSVALIALSVVGGTIAYLVASDDPVVNTFQPGKVHVQVNEPGFTNGDLVKEGVTVTAVGSNIDTYVRARLVATWVKTETVNGAPCQVTAPYAPVLGTDYSLSIGNDWTSVGNYYYYEGVVAPGGATTELVAECAPLAVNAEGYTLALDILAEGLQAEGGKDGKSAAELAWSVSIAGGVVTPVTGE